MKNNTNELVNLIDRQMEIMSIIDKAEDQDYFKEFGFTEVLKEATFKEDEKTLEVVYSHNETKEVCLVRLYTNNSIIDLIADINDYKSNNLGDSIMSYVFVNNNRVPFKKEPIRKKLVQLIESKKNEEINNRLDKIDISIQDRIIENIEKLNNKLEKLVGDKNE